MYPQVEYHEVADVSHFFMLEIPYKVKSNNYGFFIKKLSVNRFIIYIFFLLTILFQSRLFINE